MRALRYAGPGRAEVVDLPVPAIADDEVLVAARSVGVCHSDIELLEGRYIIPFSYPQIPGHEWSGQVARVGRSVTGLAPGDRVVGECVIGADHFGFSISGAAAEFFVAKPSWLHRLPDELSWTMGALVEPFSVAYYALVVLVFASFPWQQGPRHRYQAVFVLVWGLVHLVREVLPAVVAWSRGATPSAVGALPEHRTP